MESIDHLVTIRVEPHHQTFQVIFPYRIHSVDSDLVQYRRITQSHAILNAPICWVYPLLMIFKGLEIAVPEIISKLENRAREIPGYSSGSDDYSNHSSDYDLMIGASHFSTKLPALDEGALVPSHYSNTAFEGRDLNNFSKLDQICILQTELGTFTTLHCNTSVEILITVLDGTVFRTYPDFDFVMVYMKGQEEEMYLIEGVMERITCLSTKAVYKIREILSQALAMYQNSYSNQKLGIRISKKKLVHPVLHLVVSGLGEFNLKSNGICRCNFDDRTVIEFDSETEIASVFDAYGTNIKVRIANPIGFEQKVDAMLQFMEWARGKPGSEIDASKASVDRQVMERKLVSLSAQSKIEALLNAL